MLKPLLITLISLYTSFAFTQPVYRTIDGSDNNTLNPDWGATGTVLDRTTSNGYGDNISSPAGSSRPNPRFISNALFFQNINMPNPYDLSDFVWNFGQFIDHDITLVPDNHSEFLPIAIPANDSIFDPSGSGSVIIPMFRSISDTISGTDSTNPRMHINAITSWIDGSAVYGSSSSHAQWLRTFVDGKLKTSSGNLLPYNTLTGEYNDPVDPSAPQMANEGPETIIFIAGDVRCNEQPGLTAIHTLFVREHNRLCEILKQIDPGLDDETTYQKARKIVASLIQKITFEDWLPSMGVVLDSYTGYDVIAKPNIMNAFSVAAYRLGHTMVGKRILRIDSQWDTIGSGNMNLRNAFFSPSIIGGGMGISPYLRGMLLQRQQNVDIRVVDDLRNFMFGIPGAGGIDLAAINIMRGRDRGLVDYNQLRVDMGLSPALNFTEISSDPDLQLSLQSVFGNVNDIDAWVGLLAEDHVPGAIFGECITTIMKEQFERLRDGDWYYYENDPSMSALELSYIRNSTLANVINSNIDMPVNNVFLIWNTALCSTPENIQSLPSTFSADLSWDAVSGAQSYTVQGTQLGFGSSNFVTLTTTSNSIHVSGLQNNTSYYWKLRANCASGPSLYSDFDTFTTSGMICSVPMNLTESNITLSSVTLSWDASPAASGYVVRGSEGSYDKTNMAYLPVSGTSLQLNGLNSNTSYFWQVQALCSGTQPPNSAFSPVNSFTTSGPSQTAKVTGSESGTGLVSVHPNPGNGEFTLSTQGFDQSITIRVFDLSGKMMYKGKGDNGINTIIDLKWIESGSYVLQISDSVRSISKRIIKI